MFTQCILGGICSQVAPCWGRMLKTSNGVCLNACVRCCVATTRWINLLPIYTLQKPRTKKVIKLIKNSILHPEPKWISVCSLHFAYCIKTYVNNKPTIFPWSAGWLPVIKNCSIIIMAWKLIEWIFMFILSKNKSLPLIFPKALKSSMFVVNTF